MSKKQAEMKYCNCQISSNKEISKTNVFNSFCEKCGCIFLKNSKGIINYTLKRKTFPYEVDPINIIRTMKKNMEKNNNYFFDSSNKNKKIYLKYRKKLVLYLKKIVNVFNCCDLTFYHCLYFLDKFLSTDVSFEMSEKTIIYYLIGYFLCSYKLNEADKDEPSFDEFPILEKEMILSSDKIALFEIICLQKINFNLACFSPYDWLMQFISNGVVFNSEINDTNEIIIIKGHRHTLLNTINKYCLKLLSVYLTKDFYIKYPPLYLALTIIQIAREKYINKNMIKSNLFFQMIEIYDINSNNFRRYYDEIKAEIKEEENNNIKDERNKLNEIKRFSVDKVDRSCDFLNKDINIPNIKLKLKDNSNDHKQAESRNQRNSHLYIDCTFNALNSVDALPPINLKTQKDVNKPVIKLTKEFDTSNNNVLRLRESKFLTSKKLNKIKIEELTDNKKKVINDSNIFRRHSKMRTDKLLDIKHTLPKRNLFINFN